MADDPMSIWNSARPKPTSSFPEASGFQYERVTPSSPTYRSMIPPPPCAHCSEDHHPGRTYDHPYTPESPSHQQVTMPGAPPPVAPPSVTSKRVAVYVGRGDTYVVAVEQAPDWDMTESWKVADTGVMPLIRLARAVGIKVVDKTGGDLVELEQSDGG